MFAEPPSAKRTIRPPEFSNQVQLVLRRLFHHGEISLVYHGGCSCSIPQMSLQLWWSCQDPHWMILGCETASLRFAGAHFPFFSSRFTIGPQSCAQSLSAPPVISITGKARWCVP